MKKKEFRIIAIMLIIILTIPLVSLAHSGRTDSSGGHRDNKNASGLGSYHYHHGYSAHLHPNGICPYSSSSSTSTKSTYISSSTSQAKNTAVKTSYTRPSYPIWVNGENLNNMPGYYPIVINSVTYVPLSSDIIVALNLSGGWRNETEGMVMTSKTDTVYVEYESEELEFYRNTTYILDYTTNTYHNYSCNHYDLSYCDVFSKDFLVTVDQKPNACPYCIN